MLLNYLRGNKKMSNRPIDGGEFRKLWVLLSGLEVARMFARVERSTRGLPPQVPTDQNPDQYSITWVTKG